MAYREEEKKRGIMAAAKDFALFLGEKKFVDATRFSVTEATGGKWSKTGMLKLYNDNAEKYANRPIFNFVSGYKNIKNDEYLNAMQSIFNSYFSIEKFEKYVYEIIGEIVRDLERKEKFAIAKELKEAANCLTIETAQQIYC